MTFIIELNLILYVHWLKLCCADVSNFMKPRNILNYDAWYLDTKSIILFYLPGLNCALGVILRNNVATGLTTRILPL